MIAGISFIFSLNLSASALSCNDDERPFIIAGYVQSKNALCMNVWLSELGDYSLTCDVDINDKIYSATGKRQYPNYTVTFTVRLNTDTGKTRIKSTLVEKTGEVTNHTETLKLSCDPVTVD